MKLVRGLNCFRPEMEGAVLTIGNFDGLHKGHQSLITHCVALAQQRQLPSVVMTFEPYPQMYFSRNDAFCRLMSLRDKFLQFANRGVDYLLILPFNKALATLPAEEFIEKIIVQKLKTRVVIVGDDFRFGLGRQGDFNLLKYGAARFGYEALQMPVFLFDQERISSSRLRTTLAANNLELAEALLGCAYSVSGHIVRGDQRGQRFGFPTANVYVSQKKLPLSGIFVVQVDGLSEKPLPGVASVGYRPMYPAERDLLEVYLLDFKDQIYKKHVRVTFLKHLRDQVHFDSEAELIQQIEQDVLETRRFF